MIKEKKDTSVRLSKEIVARISALKICPQESYENIIGRLLHCWVRTHKTKVAQK